MGAESAAAAVIFLSEMLGIPSAPMPPGTTAIAECIVTAELDALVAPTVPTDDPNRKVTPDELTMDLPPELRATAAKQIEVGKTARVTHVTGCEEPYKSAAKAHLETSPVRPDAQRQFEGRTFTLRVTFAPPTLVRNIVSPPPPALIGTIRLDVAPEKLSDKDVYKPRDAKGGKCTTTVFIDEKGEVFALDLAECRDDLRLAIKMSAMQWKYVPGMANGAPHASSFPVDVVVR